MGRFHLEKIEAVFRGDPAGLATFKSSAKTELVAGNWDRGGAVTLILVSLQACLARDRRQCVSARLRYSDGMAGQEMAVTDDMDGEVHEMLHMLPACANPTLAECPDTGLSPPRSNRCVC